MRAAVNRMNATRRRGLTGLETAIILIAFVVVAAAFAFAVLNMGFFTTQKSGEVMQAGLEETLSGIEPAGSVIVRSDGTQVQSITIYIKSAVGKHPVDMRAGKLVISYRDPYNFNPNIYTTNATEVGTGVTVRQLTGDRDTALEYAELWEITIAIEELQDLRPNDPFSVEIKPPQGSVLKIEKRLPPVFDAVMDLG
ncbi:MAG: archaellin/type IV pilin N-terminal domain-containing protein [Candidatus Caldarchaeales archaeon]